jgi:hypothetical protein
VIIVGDCREVMAGMEPNSVDAIVTVTISRETAHVLHEIMYKADRQVFHVTAEDHRSVHVVRADELRDELYAVLHNGLTISGAVPTRLPRAGNAT